jgi:thiosulfate/3-mercaptopyruvate sulfurtransferase
MKKISTLLLSILIITSVFAFSGCADKNLSQQGKNIITSKEAAKLIKDNKTVLVDLQTKEEYAKAHIKGAVSVPLEDITQNVPYPNMLASKEKIEETFKNAGISNDSIVIAYDNSANMNAARLWWTGMMYGFENIKVISGGLKELEAQKLEVTTEAPTVTKGNFTAKDKNNDMLANLNQVKEQVNNPDSNVILLDTRSEQEYKDGTIPGSILLDYAQNNYNDGTYKSIQNILIQYKEKKINPDKTIIMYCKTSIRGAQTYLALYNAGYRNMKLYDGAYVEWSSIPSLPIQKEEAGAAPVKAGKNDNS